MEQNNDIKLPAPKDFFLETPLYKTFSVNQECFEKVVGVEYFSDTLDSFCLVCLKDDSAFYRKNTIHTAEEIIKNSKVRDISMGISDELVLTETWSKAAMDANYYLGNRVFCVDLVCSRNCGQELNFIFRVWDKTITKIGQYPSIADLEFPRVRKYRKLLADYYTELTTAIGLVSHGVGVGSFVYLRRIFEKLILEAFEEAKASLTISEEDFRDKRMEEKILLLKDYLPEFLVENRSVYKVLSKGIHSLKEEECLQFFQPVLAVIELILDEKLEKAEKTKKIEDAKKKLSVITKEVTKS
jgi:hypothetical protein